MTSKYNDKVLTMSSGQVNIVTYVPDASYPNIVGSNLPMGDNNLYTVPSGKRLVCNLSCVPYNQSAGNITAYMEYRRSGTYYQIINSVTVSTLSVSTISPNLIILEAADVLAVNTTTNNGLNIGYCGCLISNNSPLKTSSVLALSNGDNTIYTCPSGKSAILISTYYFNNSGGSITTYFNIVPSGGSPGATNKYSATSAVTNASSRIFQIPYTLSAGDFVSVNVSAGTAGQQAWCNVIEV